MVKKFLLTILTTVFCCCVSPLSAQQYFVSPIPYTPYPYTGGINVVSPLDDYWGAPIGIGFDFYFFGQSYQQLIVGTNGLVSFNLIEANKLCSWNLTQSGSLPSANLYTNAIMFPYHDVDISLGGTINHQVYGASPNRKFVVSFDSVPMYDNGLFGACNGIPNFTGQLVLHETTNIIDMFIKSKTACTGWNNGLAIMGIQDSTGTSAFTVPGRNNTVWNATNEGWRFSPDSSNAPINFNRISGRVFVDNNKDCIENGSDFGIKNRPLVFQNANGAATTYAYTDLLGNYSKLVDTGTYTFNTGSNYSQFLATNCPVGGTYTASFNKYNDSLDNQVFADTASQLCSALVPGLMIFGQPFSLLGVGVCDTAQVRISCINQGILSDTAKLVLTLNDSTAIIHSPVPYATLGNNQYLFDLGVIIPSFDTSVTLLIRIGCDTIGTSYCYSLERLSNFPVACFQYNNPANRCFFVGVPYDPNIILVSSTKKPQLGSAAYLATQNDDNFNYTVIFQNTGTAVANDVKLKIPLSSKILRNTLYPTLASAAYQWLILDSTLIVDFYNIQLPDSNTDYEGSIGYFNFSVNQNPGNVVNDFILHQAAIYFDYNSPIFTNTAIVELVDTVTVSLTEIETIDALLYPNPASHNVELILSSPAVLSVADVTGRLILQKTIKNTRTRLDVSEWSNGIYIMQLRTQNALKTIRFLKGQQ